MKNLFVATSLSMSIFIFAAIDVLDRVAIIVDEGVIMESQLQDRLQNTKIRLAEQNIQPPSEEQLLDEIKEQLIIEELQLQRGRDAGVRISDGELNQTFIRIAQNNGLSLEEFIVNYEDSGQSYEKLREEIRNDMVIQRVQQGMVGNAINITQQEIDGFLQTDEAIEQLTPELLVRQIQVATRLEADNIYQDIQSGMDFLTLVEEYSINRNKNNGGLMPWRKISTMPTVYAEALTKQKLGFVSSPISDWCWF
jgi:Parvulin-like peptidyl-prolyl isomerase